MLAPEGRSLIATAGGLAVLLLAAGFLLGGWGWSLAVFGLILLVFATWFFRAPRRTPPGGAPVEPDVRQRTVAGETVIGRTPGPPPDRADLALVAEDRAAGDAPTS